MKCPSCNSEVATGAQFCGQCGAKVSGAPDASAPGGTSAGSNPAQLGRRRPVADVPEVTLWEGRYSPKAMLLPFLVCDLMTLVALVAGALTGQLLIAIGVTIAVWALFAVVYAVRRLGIHYQLTNHMFYHRRGLLTRTVDRIEVISIDDVRWEQGLFERMVDVGTIVIYSQLDRTNKGELTVKGIQGVEPVFRLIDKARRDERVRRGFLTIEQAGGDAGGG